MFADSRAVPCPSYKYFLTDSVLTRRWPPGVLTYSSVPAVKYRSIVRGETSSSAAASGIRSLGFDNRACRSSAVSAVRLMVYLFLAHLHARPSLETIVLNDSPFVVPNPELLLGGCDPDKEATL